MKESKRLGKAILYYKKALDYAGDRRTEIPNMDVNHTYPHG